MADGSYDIIRKAFDLTGVKYEESKSMIYSEEYGWYYAKHLKLKGLDKREIWLIFTEDGMYRETW